MRKSIDPVYLSDVIGPIAPDPVKPPSTGAEPKAGESFREYHQRPASKREQRKANAAKVEGASEAAAPSAGGDRRRGSRTMRPA